MPGPPGPAGNKVTHFLSLSRLNGLLLYMPLETMRLFAFSVTMFPVNNFNFGVCEMRET